jgi:CRP-like cAMP-binding protein
LRKTEFLQVLCESQLLLIVDALHPVDAQSEEEIIKQGTDGDSFFMVIEGECSVSKPNTESTEEIGIIKSGDFFESVLCY